MANWNNPTLTSTYTNFVTEVKDRDVEAAVWFEGMSPTNLPTNAKRLNTSTGRFEKWNGSAWVDAVATFTFPALTVAGVSTFTGAATFTANPVMNGGTVNGVPYLNASKVLTTGGALTFTGSRLGIGTGAPASDVDIAGTNSRLRLDGSGTSFQILSRNTTDNVTNPIIFDADAYTFNRGGAGLLTLGSSGLTGVSKFQAQVFRIKDAAFSELYFSTADTGGNGAISYNHALNEMAFYANGSARMRLSQQSLMLGTNTSVPNSSLDIQATVSLSFIPNSTAWRSINLVNAASTSGASNGIAGVINGQAVGGIAFVRNGTASDSGSTVLLYGNGSSYAEGVRVDFTGNLLAHSGVTGGWQVPRGTTAQRPTGASGFIRFNSDLGKYEGHNGSAWSSIGGGATGGGSDDVFYENGQTVTTNYTISSGKNALSAGPVTISSGITVTVPSGSNWVVV